MASLARGGVLVLRGGADVVCALWNCARRQLGGNQLTVACVCNHRVVELAFLSAGGAIEPGCTCSRPPGTQCRPGFYTDTVANVCHACPESATQYLQPAAMGISTLVGLYVFWIYMGRDSKKLSRFKDIDVHIQSGMCETAVEVAESLQRSLATHLECGLDRVHIEASPGDLKPGCPVVVQNSGGDHDGAHGHIVKAQEDGSYRVRLEDVSKVQWFTRQQLCEQENVIENPMQAPAAIFVLTDEWVASPLCVQKITLSLAARAGMDLRSLADVDIHKELLAMPHDKLSALRTGAFLVVSSIPPARQRMC